jgi:hypothetical protein
MPHGGPREWTPIPEREPSESRATAGVKRRSRVQIRDNLQRICAVGHASAARISAVIRLSGPSATCLPDPAWADRPEAEAEEEARPSAESSWKLEPDQPARDGLARAVEDRSGRPAPACSRVGLLPRGGGAIATASGRSAFEIARPDCSTLRAAYRSLVEGLHPSPP